MLNKKDRPNTAPTVRAICTNGTVRAICNFRPVSNLPFISKVLEKVVAVQLVDYINDNDLGESLQSAYKRHHCLVSNREGLGTSL